METAGEEGVIPRLIRITTTDSFSTITASNYLHGAQLMGYSFLPGDIFFVTYNYGTSSVVSQIFTITITSSSITLNPQAAGVTLPVVSGNIADFSGTNGALVDGGLASNKILTSAITTPDIGSNLIAFDITVPVASLASAGSVALITSSGSKRYKIRTLQLNSGGTNFSGGGGDRLGQVTDGTTVYSVIPAATMQSLVNAQWGVTALPNPASAAINTSTAAGANLTFKYSGGTTDYTAGSLVMSGIVQRVA